MHDLFGAKFTLYVYYEKGDFILNNVPIKYKSEFTKNSNWLQFAYHGVFQGERFDTILVKKEFLKQIPLANSAIKIFAGINSLSHTVRFDRFYADSTMLDVSYKLGYRTLLSADTKARVSYSLSPSEVNDLWKNQNITETTLHNKKLQIVKTDFRLEKSSILDCVDAGNSDDNELIIFTHEWAFNRKNQFNLYILLFLAWINNYSYMNNLN